MTIPHTRKTLFFAHLSDVVPYSPSGTRTGDAVILRITAEERARREEKKKADKILAEENLFGYVEIVNNGVRCYKLLGEDSFKNISKATGISVKRLLYYNDLPHEIDLYRDDYVYLTKKRTTTKKRTPVYRVKAGDSMHSIAQEFGITLKALYKLNDLEYGTPAKEGMKLKLHK